MRMQYLAIAGAMMLFLGSRPAPAQVPPRDGQSAAQVPAADRDGFPATIPECFGINSHFWDFSRAGERGTEATWSLEK